jgi:hypothetical protein
MMEMRHLATDAAFFYTLIRRGGELEYLVQNILHFSKAI